MPEEWCRSYRRFVHVITRTDTTGRCRVKRSMIGGAITATALIFGISSPAQGESIDPLPAPDDTIVLWHWNDHDEFLAWDETGPDWCPQADFPVSYTYDAWGTFHVVSHGPTPGFGSNNFNETAVFENLENGKTLSWESHGVDKDVHDTYDDNGILTIEAQEAGPVTYFDSQHHPVFREAGLFTFTVVIDTNGTPDDFSDDTFI
jgi:hypothetical protein